MCGNAVREDAEQCDDGNVSNLDGCDSACRFEQAHRANSLEQRYDTDAVCPANAFGGSIGSAAQDQVNEALAEDVASGAITIMFKAMNLGDLRGQNEDAFQLGTLQGAPHAGPGYNGAADLDWWYDVKSQSVDSEKNPADQLLASIVDRKLTAGPGSLNLHMSMAGTPVLLALKNTVVRGVTDGNAALTISDGGTPGHVAEENVDPSLTSFTLMHEGTICGDILSESLAHTPVPAALKAGGSAECNEGYTDAHSYLDVLVNGCSVVFFRVINKTQPDHYLGDAPAGCKYILTKNAQRQVTGCTDGLGNALHLQHCLSHALYSTYLGYTSDRVILKMLPPIADGGVIESDGGITSDAGL